MAGSDQNNKTSRKGERKQPLPGHASEAVGKSKDRLIQNKKMEQRARIVNTPVSPRGTARISAGTKAASARKKNAGSAGTKGTNKTGKTGRGGSNNTKKASASNTRRSTPVKAQNPPADPRDTLLIQWIGNKWNALENHHQQGIISTCLLILSLLLFGSLTFFQTTPILRDINRFFLVFFGWSEYLLALGLVVFALAHLIEGIRRQQFVRISLVIGLVVIWLLLLTESALIVGPENVGILGALLVLPLLGWSRGVDHVI